LKAQFLLGAFLSAASLLATGCNVTPSSYAQWKREQDERAKYSEAGVPYKSPSQIRAEAAEMRKATEGTTFVPGK